MGIFDRIRSGRVASPAGPAPGVGSGTVTSVALSLPGIFSVSGSPVTSVGTLTGDLATQVANKVFVGPASGVDASPTFRLLVPDDLLVGGTVGQVLSTDGAGVFVWASAGGGGTPSDFIFTNTQPFAWWGSPDLPALVGDSDVINASVSGVLAVVFGSSDTASAIVQSTGAAIMTGSHTNAASTLKTGEADFITGDNAGSGGTGPMGFVTGTATGAGDSGGYNFQTGDAAAGNSGGYTIYTGTASGSRGKIRFVEGSEGTAGYVWTSTDTAGNGAWMPGGGAPAGDNNTLAYFNASGNLSDNVNAVFDESHNSLALGVIANNSSVLASGDGALSFGVAVLLNTPGVESSGGGALSHGISNGIIRASGNGSHSRGYTADSSGFIHASADGSSAAGHATNGTILSGSYGSSARGSVNGFAITASGIASTAVGTTDTGDIIASGSVSRACGDNLNVSADFATGIGIGQVVSSYAAFVIGQYGVSTGTAGSWISTDPLFVVGNGSGIGSENNAFEIKKDGTLFIKDPSLSGASVGDVWTLQDTATGEGAWAAAGAGIANSEVILSGTVNDGDSGANYDLTFSTNSVTGTDLSYSADPLGNTVTVNTTGWYLLTLKADVPSGFVTGDNGIGIVLNDGPSNTDSFETRPYVATGQGLRGGNNNVNYILSTLVYLTAADVLRVVNNTDDAWTGRTGLTVTFKRFPASGGVASGATTALDNLASVAINTDLIFDTGTFAKVKTKDNGAGNTETLYLTTGTTTAISGALQIHTGDTNSATDGDQSGTIYISSGALTVNQGTAGGIGSGQVSIATGATKNTFSGSIQITSGQSEYQSGDLFLRTGDGVLIDEAWSGEIFVKTGDVTGTAQSGAVSIITGTVGTGTRGQIKFVDGTEGTAGHLWTSTGTAGEGAWISGGASGTFTTVDLKTVTVVNGLITSIV